ELGARRLAALLHAGELERLRPLERRLRRRVAAAGDRRGRPEEEDHRDASHDRARDHFAPRSRSMNQPTANASRTPAPAVSPRAPAGAARREMERLVRGLPRTQEEGPPAGGAAEQQHRPPQEDQPRLRRLGRRRLQQADLAVRLADPDREAADLLLLLLVTHL